jgi:hypothetical protein
MAVSAVMLVVVRHFVGGIMAPSYDHAPTQQLA